MRYYDTEASVYDSERWQSRAGARLDKVHKEIVIHALEPFWPGPIIEIAAGTGRFTVELNRRGFDAIGTDISPNMIEIAREKGRRYGLVPDCRFIVVGESSLPFPHSHFRAAFMINAVSHISNLEPVFREARRVIENNGAFLVNFPNLLSPYFPFGLYVNLRGRALVRNVYTRWFNLRTMTGLLYKNGFKIDKIWGHFHYPTWTQPKALLDVFDGFDRAVRDSILKLIAPTIYLLATPWSEGSNSPR